MTPTQEQIQEAVDIFRNGQIDDDMWQFSFEDAEKVIVALQQAQDNERIGNSLAKNLKLEMIDNDILRSRITELEKLTGALDDALSISRLKISELEAAQEWRPIESAPRGGTHILVTRLPATTRPPVNKVWWGKARMEAAGWNISSKKPLSYDPTHWLPLPKPPSSEVKE